MVSVIVFDVFEHTVLVFYVDILKNVGNILLASTHIIILKQIYANARKLFYINVLKLILSVNLIYFWKYNNFAI